MGRFVSGEFRRGFLCELEMRADEWLSRADAILAAHPVERVTLTTWPGETAGWPEVDEIDVADDGAFTTKRWKGVVFTPPDREIPSRFFGPDATRRAGGRTFNASDWAMRMADQERPPRDIRHALAEAAAARFGVEETGERLLRETPSIDPMVRLVGMDMATPNDQLQRRLVCACGLSGMDIRAARPEDPLPAFDYVSLDPMPAYLTAGGVAYRWACGRCPACHRIYATARPVAVLHTRGPRERV